MAEKDEVGAGISRTDDQVMAEEKADLRARSKPIKAKVAYIGERTVVAGDTMGGIALEFYGSALEDKWMAIYEANKETIGDNVRLIKPGQVLKIPKLD